MKNCLSICALLTAPAYLLLSNSPTNGAPLLFKVKGVVSSLQNGTVDLPGVEVGDPFVAIFRYDSDPNAYQRIITNTFEPSPGVVMTYEDQLVPSSVAFSVAIEGLLFEPLPEPGESFVSVGDDLGAVEDIFMISSRTRSGTTTHQLGAILNDDTASAFTSADLPTSLDLADFGGDAVVTMDLTDSSARMAIQSLEQVPEPSTFVLCGLSVLGLMATGRLRRGRP